MSDLLLARVIAAAIRSVPGVSDVSTRIFTGAATYGPGGAVRGIAIRRIAAALDLDVHLIARYTATATLPDVAAAVRRSIQQAVAGVDAGPVRRIDVMIDDLDMG